jgi:hypothetical protein
LIGGIGLQAERPMFGLSLKKFIIDDLAQPARPVQNTYRLLDERHPNFIGLP